MNKTKPEKMVWLTLVLLLLIMSCLSFARFARFEAKASSNLPVHNLSTGLNYSKIQEAIDANETLNGQTILVDAGEYNETVVIDKSIRLIGENSSNTVINATYEIPPTSSINPFNALLNVTASNAEISGFDLAWGWYFVGISASSCSNITIKDNMITQAGQAISLTSVTQSTIAGNALVGRGLEGNDLLSLDSCSGCIINDNTIEGSCYQGISLHASDNNLICNNLIYGNGQGLEFIGSYGNTIFHNNIEGNYQQVTGGASSSFFSKSSEGNYWSDYTGKDANQDGIGDTPYDNLDYYPFMGPFEEFSTLNYNVETISNSTISDFQFNGTAILFNVTGEDGTTGFCRVSFPTALLNGTLTVFVNGTELPYTLLPESSSTQSILYFTYHHSTEQVIVAPEFLTFILLPFFVIATLIATVFCKKKAPTRKRL